MKNTPAFIKIFLMTSVIVFCSIISVSAQEEVSPNLYKSNFSLGINYAFVPKWEIKTSRSLTLSYQRLLNNPSFSVVGDLNYLSYWQRGISYQPIPSSLTHPHSLAYFMFSGLLSYSFLNELGKPRNFGFAIGPSFRMGAESYHQQSTPFEGLFLFRNAADWGVVVKIAYKQPLSKRFSLKISGQYQYYFSNRPNESYSFQAPKRVFIIGGALVFNL